MLGYGFGRRWAGSAIRFVEFLANVECTGDPFVGINTALVSDRGCPLYRHKAVEYVGVSLIADGI